MDCAQGYHAQQQSGTDANGCALPPQCVPDSQSCTFNGQTIASGSAVTGYQSSSVSYGSQCVSAQLTCTNGTLSNGSSYPYASCSVSSAPPPAFSASPTSGAAPLTVNFSGVGTSISFGNGTGQAQSDGVPLNQVSYTYNAPGTYTATSNGQSVTITAAGTAVASGIECIQGYEGNPNNPSQCIPIPNAPTQSCTFNGQTIASGSAVTGYQSSSVPYGSQCVSQRLTCTNGAFGAFANASTYPYASCSVSSASEKFSASPTSGAAPLTVSFSAFPLTGTSSYTINFGDGTSGAVALSPSCTKGQDCSDSYTGFATHTYTGAASGQTQTASSCVTLAQSLSLGSSGSSVISLQNFLIARGLLADGYNTGYFGSFTQSGVQTWQSEHGIVSSGTSAITGYGSVGPRTRASMSNCGSSSSGSTNSSSSQTQGSYTATLLSSSNVSMGTASIAVSTPVSQTPSIKNIPYDFDGNGISDALWRNAAGQYSLWLMNGNVANYQTVALAPPSDTSYTVAGVGDFTGNGRSDILFRNPSGTVGEWLMNSGGTAYTWILLGNPDPSLSVAGVGDFTGDGRDDILFRNNSSGQVGLWLMNPGGFSYTWESVAATSDTSFSVAGVGDFNGDGIADILWRNNSSGEVGLWLMGAGGTYNWMDLGSSDTSASVIGVGDFDGSGRDDILWQNSSGSVYVWLMNPDGASYVQKTLGTAGSGFSAVEVGDFNGDGLADILWKNNSSGQVGFWITGPGLTYTWTDAYVGPCDILAQQGSPCVAAHSVTRKMTAAYTGSAFQLQRTSDGATLDVGFKSSGLVNLAPVGSFCAGTICNYSIIYDQMNKGNNLPQPVVADQAPFSTVAIPGGGTVPIVRTVGGEFYRNRTSTTNIPTGDQSITEYYIRSSSNPSTCCGDYGNMESTADRAALQARGYSITGHMFALAYTNYYTSTPEFGIDRENGFLIEPYLNIGSIFDLVAKHSSANNTTAIKLANTPGTFQTLYNGADPVPLDMEGGLSLGEGGDASWAPTAFFEGAIINSSTSDAADTQLQMNTSAFYGGYGGYW